jgi:DNA-binding MarR family transcriptional regulator
MALAKKGKTAVNTTYCASSRQKSKSPIHSTAGRLSSEAGLSQAQVRVAIEILSDHLEAFYSEARDPGQITHTAVSAEEPAGKPIKDCKIVSVRLTVSHEADVELIEKHGSVELRMARIYRLCCEARDQGGLLSYEDLRVLLGIDISTVGDLVKRLRDRGLVVPTRGAVKDIGPEPSHKRIVAELLARGFSTSQIRSMTKHSEGAIGRYQHQFALVLYLLHAYPTATDDERRLLSGLPPKAYKTYLEVADAFADSLDCQCHLERLRRRYELDPENFAHSLPQGKAPKDQAHRRLEQQKLPVAVRQTIEKDLGTTPRVAETVADDLMALIDKSFRLTDSLRPGELVVFADAHDAASISGERTTDRAVIPVKLPVYTEEALELWRADEPIGRRRARIAAMVAMAAAEQGAVMTVAKLAELLFVSDSTMAKDLRKLAVACNVETPIKGTIEDAGGTLTHKDWIVDLDQHGLTGDEIAWLTRHAPHSRDRYIETYRRAETLMRLEERIPEPKHLARVLRLRIHVARQYVDLLRKYHGDGKDIDELPFADAETVDQ